MTTPMTPTRHSERNVTGRAALDAVLDEALVCTVSSVVDGSPWALPNLFARRGDDILLHGSTGAGLYRHLAAGAPVVLSVFELHGLVFADSLFDTSANYVSAVVSGQMRQLHGEEKEEAVVFLTDRLVPGRPTELPAPTKAEWAATMALSLTITEDNWTVKRRTGGPSGDVDPTGPWVGHLPRSFGWGTPVPGSDDIAAAPLPAAISHYGASPPCCDPAPHNS